MHYQAGPFFLNTFDFHKNFPNTNFEEKSGFAQFGWQLLDLSFMLMPQPFVAKFQENKSAKKREVCPHSHARKPPSTSYKWTLLFLMVMVFLSDHSATGRLNSNQPLFDLYSFCLFSLVMCRTMFEVRCLIVRSQK